MDIIIIHTTVLNVLVGVYPQAGAGVTIMILIGIITTTMVATILTMATTLIMVIILIMGIVMAIILIMAILTVIILITEDIMITITVQEITIMNLEALMEENIVVEGALL